MTKSTIKLTTTLICLLPLLGLFFDIVASNLGANPIQGLHIRLGDWTLRFICITLAITPIQTVTGWKGMSDYRQLFGLFSFFYGTLHVFAYLSADHFFVWDIIAIDIIESPYIWFGVLAYLIMLALALTTSKKSKKWLGKNWKKLHRFIYLAAIAAIVHYFWQLKGNLADPILYGILITALLLFRFLNAIKNRKLAYLMLPKGKK